MRTINLCLAVIIVSCGFFENVKLTFTFKRGDGIFTVDFVKQDLEEN
jgi:hypothetical protein